MNVLITGCAGFVGFNMATKFLTNPNVYVFGLDDFSTGKLSHVELLRKNSRFRFNEVDCRNLESVTALEMPKIDLLIHLAANSDIAAALLNPTIDYELGIGTTHTMLEYARKNEIKHFVFSSGSGVYGENPNEIFTEESFVGQPTSTYGATKLASEALISAYSFMFEIKATIFRFSNLIGPFHTHGVIFDFIKKLMTNPCELSVLGDGTQLKPYIHIDDALEGILIALEKQEKNFEVFNVSNNDAIPVSKIAEMVVSIMKLENVEIKYQDTDRGWKADIPRYMMSSNKLHKLGWKIVSNSEQAVQKAIEQNYSSQYLESQM